ncbi:MAG: phenylacetate--CoA ligase family protein [Acidimicrobiia bacterium]
MTQSPADTATEASEALRRDRRARFAAAIGDHIERLAWGPERIDTHQREQLRELLAHAIERSPFHAARLEGVDPSTFELEDLPSLPVMTKTEMMAGFDALVTDRRLSRKAVEDHLASLRERPEFLLDEYTCLASGGASGEKGVFVYDAKAIVDCMAAGARRALSTLLSFGEPPPGGVPMAFVSAGSPVHATNALGAIASGGFISATMVPATLPVPEMVARLNELQPLLVLGYPSAVTVLAAEQEAGRLAIHPLAITTSSETLTVEVRQRITGAFGVPVANQFGSSEGLFGVSEPGEDPIAFASDLAIVELVDDDGRPVPNGTPSSRVLVTNLFNRTQPLIRYELTDRFVRCPEAAGHGHLRATVDGRAAEMLRWGDLTVHPHAIRSVLVRAPAVVDYQVRQTNGGVDVVVAASGSLDTTDLAGQLTDALQRAGMGAPTATVRRVAALSRNPETGKLATFIPQPGPRH